MESLRLFFIISLIILSLSCTRTEYIEVPVEVYIIDTLCVNDSINILVNKDDLGYFGASGNKNGDLLEYGGAEFVYDDQERFSLQIASFEWYENIIWAYREVISFVNVPISSIGDTIILESHETFEDDKIIPLFFHIYGDGDIIGECYGINLDSIESWLLITEYDNENGEMAGTIHADYVWREDLCGSKFDESQPDIIRLRNFWFRAKLRE